jgi:chromosomal replication initiation ATPase DnaA
MRQLAIYLAHKHSGETNVIIGKEFGEIAGSTITYLLRKVKNRLRQDREFEKYVLWVKENLISKG